MCLLEGQSLRPELPGHCTEKCTLYLSECVPIVSDGLLDGCECAGDSYCLECPYYEECGKQKGEAYVIKTAESSIKNGIHIIVYIFNHSTYYFRRFIINGL